MIFDSKALSPCHQWFWQIFLTRREGVEINAESSYHKTSQPSITTIFASKIWIQHTFANKMMFSHTTTLVFLSTLVATSTAVLCPFNRPNATTTCDFRNQDCRYGQEGCTEGFEWQCRCANEGDPFVCSCRGDLGASLTKDLESDLDVNSVEISGAASSALTFSAVLLSGMVALL